MVAKLAAPPLAEAAAVMSEESEEEFRRRQIEINHSGIALLRSWREADTDDDVDEARADLEKFMRAIDEDREGGRKLFAWYRSSS